MTRSPQSHKNAIDFNEEAMTKDVIEEVTEDSEQDSVSHSSMSREDSIELETPKEKPSSSGLLRQKTTETITRKPTFLRKPTLKQSRTLVIQQEDISAMTEQERTRHQKLAKNRKEVLNQKRTVKKLKVSSTMLLVKKFKREQFSKQS